jgi:hypothetical protein
MNDTALATLSNHKTLLTRGDRTAVIRCATRRDLGPISRLLEKSYFPTPPRSAAEFNARRRRIRSVALLLRKPMTRFVVIEVGMSLCATNCFRFGRDNRVFSSNGAISLEGRAFDSRLILRLAEHFVGCCRLAGWSALQLFANFENERAAEIFASYFARKGVESSVERPRLGVLERVTYGGHKHLIAMSFRKPSC